MLSTENKRPIEIGILEISSQNKAILEFFFNGAGKSCFKEVTLDKASAYIIDYDSVGAKESWESTFKKTKSPGIIISIKEVNLPSAVWLQKPLTVKALKEAGDSIREMMLAKASSKPVIPTSNERTAEISQVNELPTEEIIDIPSNSIDQIIPKKSISEKLADTFEPIEYKTEEAPLAETLNFDDSLIDLIEETTKAPKESQLANEPREGKTSKVEPEQSMTDTKASASSSNFSATTNFVDIDHSLGDLGENLNDSINQKSSTTPIAMPNSMKTNKDNEIDSLLESLISDGKNNKKLDKLIDQTTDNHTDLLDFDFETVDIETEKEENASPEADLNLASTKIIEDDGLSLDLENNELVEPVTTEFSNELTTATPNSLKTTTAIDNEEINKILRGKSEVIKPKKTAEEELQSLLEEIRQEAEETTKIETTPTLDIKGSAQKLTKFTPSGNEDHWRLTCGDNNIVDIKNIRLFNPSNHLLASLIKNVQVAKQSKKVSRMKFNGIIVVIDPEADRIYCDQSISTEYFANLCFEPMLKEKIKAHKLDISEIRLYRKKLNENTEYTYDTEAFIWTLSLLTSRGRLPKNTNIKAKIGLINWPNLTRVEPIPHMMQIAALMHKNTSSLLDITNNSGISKNYVIAFYNAVLALDMIQIDEEAEHYAAPLDLKIGNNKNFFSRFIKKITA